MTETHEIAKTHMVGDVNDGMATVTCTCGWVSKPVDATDGSVPEAMAEHVREASAG